MKKEFYQIARTSIQYILLAIVYMSIAIILILFCTHLILFIFNDIIVKKDILISFILNVTKMILQDGITPFITLVTAQIVVRQWKIDNFMKMRNKLIEEEQKYRQSSKKLANRYVALIEQNRLDEDVEKEILHEKSLILSTYLNEIEALALYIYYNVVDRELVKKYFSDWFLSLNSDDTIKDFIQTERESIGSNTIFEYTLKLLDDTVKEKNHEKTK